MSDPKSKDQATAETPPEAPRPNLRREDVKALFKRGQEFTEELLADNERLRFQVASYEEEVAGLKRRMEQNALVRELMARVQSLEEERQHLLEVYRTVEAENRDFSAQYAEIEEAHNNLANLYVASYQLHSTLVFQEVIQIVCEILLNLVGAQDFALYVLDEETSLLHPLVTEGEVAGVTPLKLGEGGIGRAVADNNQHLLEHAHRGTLEEPLAVVPLVVGDRRVGAIALFKLLVQKPALSGLDVQLLSLLGAHAATAIRASAQYSAAPCKATLDLYARLWSKSGHASEG